MTRTERFLQYYYLGTPAFMLIDYGFGQNVRAAGFQGHPVWKGLYYAFCFSCLMGMYLKPNRASMIALFENIVNVVSLILAFVVPYYTFMGQYDSGSGIQNPMTIQGSINFLIASLAACLALNRSLPQTPR